MTELVQSRIAIHPTEKRTKQGRTSLPNQLVVNLSNSAVENDRKHDDLAMGSMGIRPHGQQRIASCIWNMHRITLEHAWNNTEKTGWI